MSDKCEMMALSVSHLLFLFLEGFVAVLIFMRIKNINSISLIKSLMLVHINTEREDREESGLLV